MKYWRGYLVAGILFALTWALTQFAAAHTPLIDMVYPYVTRTVVSFLADWSAGASFCLWQVLLIVLLLGVLSSLILMIILHWNPVQWLGWILAAVSCVTLLHTGIYGLNYYAGSIADDIRLTVAEYTVSDLVNATEFYRDKANALADQVNRDETGSVLFSSFDDLSKQSGNGFQALTYEKAYSIFSGSTAPVKKLGWSNLYSAMGISGVTITMTGEAAVNPRIPSVSIPFTMCHEMAHRMSIASEQDANFAAFLACDANESVEFQYSAYFMAFRYCLNTLANSSTSTAQAAVSRIQNGVGENLRRDLDDYRTQLLGQQDKNAVDIASSINDSYLKTSGEAEGTASYSAVSDLLVSWHIQEYVLPLLADDEEDKFDPFDESQVDLSGIANAK